MKLKPNSDTETPYSQKFVKSVFYHAKSMAKFKTDYDDKVSFLNELYDFEVINKNQLDERLASVRAETQAYLNKICASVKDENGEVIELLLYNSYLINYAKNKLANLQPLSQKSV